MSKVKSQKLKIVEGSNAIAQAVKMSKVGVVCAYPITPQTHIVEDLAKFKADGRAYYQYVLAESEFAAASIVLGAAIRGVRAYTATSSQGLLLMTEVLFNIAGMRLPIVLTCANRAVSAPINIWNDQQDSMTVRDSGWLMLYAETNQEAVDLHLQAFKIAEKSRLPVMVNVDGFVLTHTYEPVDMPDQKMVDRYLKPYKPVEGTYTDVGNPLSFGTFATPEHYMQIRQSLQNDFLKSRDLIIKENQAFEKIFKRNSGGLIEYIGPEKPKAVFISMGSVCSTIRTVLVENKKFGLLKIKTFRPFPDQAVADVLRSVNFAGVVDKSISLGSEGCLAQEIKRICFNHKLKISVKSYIVGLGGKDVTVNILSKIAADIIKNKSNFSRFIYE